MESPKLDLNLMDNPIPDVRAGFSAAEKTAFLPSESSVGNAEMPVSAPQVSVFHEATVATPVTTPTTHLNNILAAILLLLVAGWLGFQFLVYNQAPLEALAGLFRMFSSEPDVTSAVATVPPEDIEVSRHAIPDKVVPHPGQTAKNPYQKLEQEVSQATAAILSRKSYLSAEDEEAYRAKLSSADYYHRYAAVQDLIANRQEGSEPLLREAMHTGKFWMRMHAAMGLADMGYKVDSRDVVTAIGDAHSELTARFFERFKTLGRCGGGCMLVLRKAMASLDARGRLEALNVLATDASEEGAMYVIAATFDEDPSVRARAEGFLRGRPVDDVLWWRTYNLIFKS